MQLGRSIANALSALWFGRAVGIAMSLALIPIMFRNIAQDELGVWLLMGQVGAIIMLMDFGVTNVLMRRIAMTSAQHCPGTEVADLLASGRPLYVGAAALVLLTSLGAGWVFLPRLGLHDAARVRVGLAWSILCVSYAYNVFGAMWTAVISGLGYVATASLLTTAASLLICVTQAGSVVLGGGVIALSILTLAGSIIQRRLTLRVLRSREPLLLSSPGRVRRQLVVRLLHTSARYWLTELGAIALLRTDQIFIAGYLRPSAIPAYYAAYSVLFSMANAAMVIAEAGSVFVSRIWSADDPKAVHTLVLRSTCVGLTLMVSGAAMMAVIGDSIITLWLGPDRFVGRPTLLVFCIAQILYVQQSLLLNFSRATENETYAPCYLAAGAVNVGVTWLLVGPLGVLGVALGTLIAQTLTTSWYVPGSALRQLHIRVPTYLAEVLAPAAQTGVLTAAATSIGALCAQSGSNLERTAAGGLAGSAAVAVGLWFFVFDRESRSYARHEIAALARRLRTKRAEQRT